MNAREVMECMDFLRTAQEGQWAYNCGRTVEVVDMIGGRYLLTDENGDVDGLTFSVEQAVKYLMEA